VPEIFLVLGSGLGEVASGLDRAVSVSFREIPGFPGAGVEGHAGRLLAGELEGRRVLAQAGRFHFYEGHGRDVVVAPVHLAARLGATRMIVTNAAGGIAPALAPGSILLIADHLDFQGRSPLFFRAPGPETDLPDSRTPYDPGSGERAREVARELGIDLARGTYAAVLGPSYETPAEVRFLRRCGAHAVGMSTVPEVVAAAALGLRVVGLSLVTNRAAGLGSGVLSHEEVLETGRRAGDRLRRLVRALLPRLP
jgi:purine-nucleoside phosphorylase